MPHHNAASENADGIPPVQPSRPPSPDASEEKGDLIPKKLEELLTANPEASFTQLQQGFLDAAPALGGGLDEQRRVVLQRPLNARLSRLKNAYHDMGHALEVEERVTALVHGLSDTASILSDRERILLIEAARRHDDEHSGSTYRQIKDPKLGKNLSNEEWAVLLLMADNEDTGKMLGQKDLEFMKGLILATSFGQDKPEKLPEGRSNCYRSYQPESPAQKMLALADVGGFMKGWKEWVEESFRVLEEGPLSAIPADGDAWLNTRKGFINFFVRPLLEGLKDVLKPDFFNLLQTSLDTFIQKIEEIRNNPDQKEQKYTKRLQLLREKKEADRF